MNNLLVGLLVFLIETFIVTIIGVFAVLYRWRYNQVNNIDVTIVEITKNGYIGRTEKGRREFESGKGFRIVTAKRWGFVYSVKDNLGYNFSGDDLINGYVGKRKFLIAAVKDGLAASMEFAEKELSLTPEQTKVINDMGINKVEFKDLPITLSLKPVKSEQTRFSLDASADAEDMFGISARKRAARNMFMVAIGLLTFSVIISFVILVIMVTQAPNFAAEVASNSAQAVAAKASAASNIIPGLPG